MKNLCLPLIAFFTLLLFLSGGCDLFGDDEHCRSETVDSKIWTPDKYPMVAYIPEEKLFFPYSSHGNERTLLLYSDNVCPFGAISVKVKFFEKGSFSALKPDVIGVKLIEYSYKNNIRKMNERLAFYAYRVSPFEFQGQGNFEMAGLIDGGKRAFGAICYAGFKFGTFNDGESMKNWGKQNVTSIELSMNYTKWE